MIRIKRAPLGYIAQMFLNENISSFIDVTGHWSETEEEAIASCLEKHNKKIMQIKRKIEKQEDKLHQVISCSKEIMREF